MSKLKELEEALWNLREAFEHEIKSIEVSKKQYKRLKWYCLDKIKEESLAELYPQTIEFFGIHIKETLELIANPRIEELEKALNVAIDAITSEYCSHGTECGAGVRGCYASNLYKILEKK